MFFHHTNFRFNIKKVVVNNPFRNNPPEKGNLQSTSIMVVFSELLEINFFTITIYKLLKSFFIK